MPPNIASCCSDQEVRAMRELKAGAQADFYYLERVTGIAAATLSQYLRGRRPCPPHIAEKIRFALEAWEAGRR